MSHGDYYSREVGESKRLYAHPAWLCRCVVSLVWLCWCAGADALLQPGVLCEPPASVGGESESHECNTGQYGVRVSRIKCNTGQ